ncbi:hypothetical protein [Peribacillus sp. JNUCC41]|uniref:hypothetical protein n=1 Tax=Peribacillus sp. JNUCC41 TaxID=2778370 RepID=UPI001787669A|nr:hypothetical protein [Brevibacillus sp. JNUCC-41]QOS91421.1 hypothetical protein JNUCC41_06820 [Brevibacillus sp. JNUCC-41]
MVPKVRTFLMQLRHPYPHHIPHKKGAYSTMTRSSKDEIPMKKPFRDNPQMAIIYIEKIKGR